MFYYFPGNYGLSFQMQRVISQSHFGGGCFNELDQVGRAIDPNNSDSWYNEWSKLAYHIYRIAEEAQKNQHVVTASDAYLRAANYYRSAEFFLHPGDERKVAVFEKGRNSFKKGFAGLNPVPEPIEIPYENSFMYGYFLAPEKKTETAPPVVIFFGGLDSTAEEAYFACGLALSRRGIASILVDGPGQGATLRINNIPSRFDYEVPVKDAVDYALTRKDIDPNRIVLMSWSMGGYYAARAAAFEKRIAACVVWGAAYDYAQVWRNRPDNHSLVGHFQAVMGAGTLAEARQNVEKFTLTEDIVKQIECPTLVIHGKEDVQVPESDAIQLYNELTCRKQLKIFTPEEGGSAHCQMDNLHLGQACFGDWLEDILKQR